ncbi:PD-(D/E)XK nuclease family protein [Faecalibacter bovis]|uniref:PD-(D/E)XK nuclease family protein n=1 Tax=Faecalibacter bovis TaxID=2898187 RepID=A0ABX7XDJ8_9FLAO|nr:PD-(D/E)XK nuclease family protein [Faecalibacter bovis]QTV05914.1 PD-(D/E)XK nuclease family protein [Faecalibacter bovis]
MKAPNIFKFATKELSQDAFLCWLFSFADKKYKKSEYEHLHQLATKFIQRLIDNDKLKIESIKVRKQIHKIDIWVEVNDDTLLIIEDKTDSKAGKNQLEKYYEVATKECPNRKISAIYFKTGNESTHTFTKSNTTGHWEAFKLEDIVEVLSPFQKKISHAFFTDYLEICLEKYNRLNDFEKWIKKTELNAEINDVVEAFYVHLEKDNVFYNWQSNDMRGVKYYYANNYKYSADGDTIYTELNRFDFKLILDLDLMGDATGKKYKKFKDDLANRQVRFAYDELFKLFQSKAPKLNLVKPKKYSCHNFLKFAVIPAEEWMVFNSDNTFNYQSSKENIESINKLVAKVIEENKQEIRTITAQAKEYK